MEKLTQCSVDTGQTEHSGEGILHSGLCDRLQFQRFSLELDWHVVICQTV